jgi:hypothetical protein
LQYAADNGFIDTEILYFNNPAETNQELEIKWIIAVKDSWLRNRISF